MLRSEMFFVPNNLQPDFNICHVCGLFFPLLKFNVKENRFMFLKMHKFPSGRSKSTLIHCMEIQKKAIDRN